MTQAKSSSVSADTSERASRGLGRRRVLAALGVGLALTLSGCGFQLRGVNDAPMAVTAFTGQVEIAFLRASGKRHPALNQPTNRMRAALHGEAHSALIAQACARDQGVLHMRVDGVARRQHRRNPALGVVRAALFQGTFCDHRALNVSFGEAQGGSQAGRAATYDQNARVVLHHGYWG